MRISDWSSDVCSSDLRASSRRMAAVASRSLAGLCIVRPGMFGRRSTQDQGLSRRDGASHLSLLVQRNLAQRKHTPPSRSEEHTSELQSLMRNSYAVF